MKSNWHLLFMMFVAAAGCVGSSQTEAPGDTGSDTGEDTVGETEVDTGSETGEDTGSETEADAGSATEADTGSATESDTGDAIEPDPDVDSERDTGGDTEVNMETDDGVCTDICSAFTAADPVVGDGVSVGSVTTYGSPDDPEYSVGGACNYGQTQLQYYAAIHVHVSASSSDFLGPWNNGHACGGCLRVRTRTAAGWKETIVRITDRCADEFCGVDLGGAPAAAVMPMGPGRYEGEWAWISCEEHPELFDGPTAIYVKDGTNPYWSVIQVRNPLSRVTGISVANAGESEFTSLSWAIEAENFYSVPANILQDDSPYTIRIDYAQSASQTLVLNGTDLAIPEASYPVAENQP